MKTKQTLFIIVGITALAMWVLSPCLMAGAIAAKGLFMMSTW